jgi:hypothetical protein
MDGSAPPGEEMTTILKTSDFEWHGLELRLRSTGKPILELVADDTYPHLFRIHYPDGWFSSPGNLTRAKDAAYGHARYLLAEEMAYRAGYSLEDDLVVPTLPDDVEAA